MFKLRIFSRSLTLAATIVALATLASVAPAFGAASASSR